MAMMIPALIAWPCAMAGIKPRFLRKPSGSAPRRSGSAAGGHRWPECWSSRILPARTRRSPSCPGRGPRTAPITGWPLTSGGISPAGASPASPGTSRASVKSTGDYNPQTFRDRADEALAAVRFLRGRSEVRKDRVGLWGHSQGGTVAPLAASLSGEVAFLIEVGGSQVVAWRQDSLRVEAELRADGFPEDDIREAVAFARMRMDLIRGQGRVRGLEKIPCGGREAALVPVRRAMRQATVLLGEEDGRVRPRPGLGERADAPSWPSTGRRTRRSRREEPADHPPRPG